MRLLRTRSPRHRLLHCAIRAALCAATIKSGFALAATITVTDAGDSGTVSTCTLRQAVIAANTNSAGTSSCTAGSGADTIVFDAGISSITLGASGQLTLTDTNKTTISGGTGVTIDGNDASRVFLVAPGAKAALDHLTVQHGKASNADGAGILCNNGTLTVTDSTITGNATPGGNAGGIGVYPTCTATLTNTVVSGNTATYSGGGIKTLGTLVLDGSTVVGNSGALGGGIYAAAGQLTATDTTISGNSAPSGGGIGVSNANASLTRVSVTGNTAAIRGGGLNARAGGSGNVSLVNTTLSGNSAPSSPALNFASSGAATFVNCTVSGNIGAYAINVSSGSATLTNTIVANTVGSSSCSGTIVDGGGNLDDGASCGFGLSSLSNTDPALGTLADNGGATLTQLPQPGSAVIDAIECTNSPADDQRGVPRPQGAKCDIGAVEGGLTLTVTDDKPFGFYGETTQYIVTLVNKSASLAAAGVRVSATASAALDDAGTVWSCTGGDCTTTPTGGPLDDTATIPAGGSLTWEVSVPVFADSNAADATLLVSASGAGTTSDTNTLAIFRATFE